MLEKDYLMRMILVLVEGIRRTLEMSKENDDPGAAADSLEEIIGQATDIDGAILLSLAPESIADILQVSGTDPSVVEFVGRSMLLESSYLAQAGDAETSLLRKRQAEALASSYGFSLGDESQPEAQMHSYIESIDR